MLFLKTKPQLTAFKDCPEKASEADIDRTEAYWKQWPLGPALNYGHKLFIRGSVKSHISSWSAALIENLVATVKLFGELAACLVGTLVLVGIILPYLLVYLPLRGLFQVLTSSARKNISQDIEVGKKWGACVKEAKRKKEEASGKVESITLHRKIGNISGLGASLETPLLLEDVLSEYKKQGFVLDPEAVYDIHANVRGGVGQALRQIQELGVYFLCKELGDGEDIVRVCTVWVVKQAG